MLTKQQVIDAINDAPVLRAGDWCGPCAVGAVIQTLYRLCRLTQSRRTIHWVEPISAAVTQT